MVLRVKPGIRFSVFQSVVSNRCRRKSVPVTDCLLLSRCDVIFPVHGEILVPDFRRERADLLYLLVRGLPDEFSPSCKAIAARNLGII